MSVATERYVLPPSSWVWLLAILAWVVGDSVTTVWGLSTGGLELNPYVRWVIATHGPAVWVAGKGVTVVVFASLSAHCYRLGARRLAWFVPAATAVAGCITTINNLFWLAL